MSKVVLISCVMLTLAGCGSGATASSTTSTAWGWIIAGVVTAGLLAAGAITLARRSRRRKSAERWRISATDAYGRAQLIDDLASREPASPELRRRLAEARASFSTLASSGPDVPSMQAASLIASALDALDTALRTEALPLAHARDRLNRALALLWPLLGTVSPGGWDRATPAPPPPTGDPHVPR